MNVEKVRHTLRNHEAVQMRSSTIQKATEINPDFRNPYITGGMLRDILLGEEPRDCDVVFEGIEVNQPGVLEAIQEAEVSLGLEPFPNWEFDNTFTYGITPDIVENTIGFYSNHTDFLTLVMYNGNEELHLGDERTMPHLETRTYDPRYEGMMSWIGLRGRTFHEVVAGNAQRGLYLTHRLNLNPSDEAVKLFGRLDFHFQQMPPEKQELRRVMWNRKTADLPGAEMILEQYGVTSFSS